MMNRACCDESWFQDVTEQVGLAGLGPEGHVAWGDYDGDGWVDVYIDGELYRNENGQRFVKVTKDASLPKVGNDGIWGDYDNDGHLDLFVWGDGGWLFRNNGDGTFSDASEGLPALPTVRSYGACWADLGGNGLLDLYVGGSEGGGQQNLVFYPDAILINKGAGDFEEYWPTLERQRLPARGVTDDELAAIKQTLAELQ